MNHAWQESSREPHRTVRVCTRCELIKVTRHETEAGRDVHWTEFWRGTERIEGERMPKCERAEVEA